MLRKQRLLVLLVIAAVILTMFAGWLMGTGQDITGQASKLIAIGRLAGIVATASVLLELLLMSRAPFIEKNFDLEEINEFHRLNGYTMVYALCTHVVFLVMGYGVNSHLGWWPQFLQLNTGFEDVLKASIGSVVFIITAITSLHLMRKYLPYEVWYFIHIVVYGGVLLAFGHQVHSGGDIVSQNWMQIFWYLVYGFVFAMLAYYRFGRQILYLWLYNFTVSRVVQESRTIFSVYIAGKSINKFKYNAGNYASLRFFNKDLFIESHPFSIASVAGANELRFTIKASGDFTKQLPAVPIGTKVLIDGPRGSFTADRATKNNVLLIAGGIGFAPFIPLASTLLANGKNVQVLYTLHDASEIVFKQEFSDLLAKYPKFRLKVHISGTNGRITADLLKHYSVNHEKEISTFICGPDEMTTKVREMLINLGMPKRNITTERFSF